MCTTLTPLAGLHLGLGGGGGGGGGGKMAVRHTVGRQTLYAKATL